MPNQMKQRVDQLPIVAIDFRHSLWPVREILRDADLHRLRDDIRANGLRSPILVRPDPVNPERYQLVEGRMRIEVAIRERWDFIPALIEDISIDEAVARVMSAEFATWAARSALERAWMLADAQRSYEAIGLSSSIRSMSTRWSIGRSTLGNALRVATVFPKRRVEGFAARFACSVSDLADIDQAPLLLIASKPAAARSAFASAAFQAHLHGDGPLEAIRSLAGNGEAAPRLELRADGMLQVRAGRPIARLSPSQLQDLAENCEGVAAELRKMSKRGPTAQEPVQQLDASLVVRCLMAVWTCIRRWYFRLMVQATCPKTFAGRLRSGG